jgi:hypothetical protein
MNRDVLDGHLGNRSAESHIINYAYDRVCLAHAPVRDVPVPAASLIGGSNGTVTFTRVPNRRIITSFRWRAVTCTWPTPPELALHAIRDILRHEFVASDDPQLELTRTMHTEYSRHGVISRAHPMYRSKQTWHDWVMIRYAKSAAEKARNKSYQERSHADEVFYGDSPDVAKDHHYAPGKILAFVEGGNDTI